jgi:hypothetical protein
MRLGTEADLTIALQALDLSGRLNTAFIERAPLTVRHAIAAASSMNLSYGSAVFPAAGLSGVVASVLSRMSRPHESLRVRLEPPRERGGKRLPQHYRQRTEALAGGRTNRRWTAREVLISPLTLASA